MGITIYCKNCKIHNEFTNNDIFASRFNDEKDTEIISLNCRICNKNLIKYDLKNKQRLD